MQSAERLDVASKAACSTHIAHWKRLQKQAAENQASLDLSRACDVATLDDIGRRCRLRTPADVDELVVQSCIYGGDAAPGLRLERLIKRSSCPFFSGWAARSLHLA